MDKREVIVFILFFCGGLVGLFSGLRLFIRAYVFMRSRKPHPWDPLGDLLARTRFKNTVGLELLGWVAGLLMLFIAIQLM
jgi:hypothetical protein